MLRIAYYPAFDAEEPLTDRYWRAVHYLAPVAGEVAVIVFAGRQAPIGAPPDYLDSAISAREAPVREKLIWSTIPDLSADYVIVWDASRSGDAVLKNVKRRAVLDPNMLHEGDLAIELGWEISHHDAQSAAPFSQVLQQERRDIVHVFGTGPTVAALRSIEPGVSIVCNSLVKDEGFLDRIRPRFITAIDPIFHAGPSRHAGAFREALIRALRAQRSWFVIQARDAHLYRALLPRDLHDLVLPIPVRYATGPNLDLTSRFWVTATRNVLTLTMLPLAANLGRDIRVYGCDGRPAKEAGRFWDYAPGAAFTPELALQQAAHPGFFTLDHQDYYALHCETVRRWVVSIERTGARVRSATPSYIPALAARRMPGVAPRPTNGLGFALRGRGAYLWRQAQSAYGAALSDDDTPAWLKLGLRLAVRTLRGGAR